ncbi:DsbA family protein [Runella zeae]|uniref:DsbA family protein n=1 Tax=Runella zeae TaxID=94255 RepID=UPI0023521A5E|nr:DsbA family protein [Runella zeae]
METNLNPLLCDTEEGICELPTNQTEIKVEKDTALSKNVKVLYFTDPICSSCWGIEPQLRKLKLEYGQDVEIEYHMGGLLPDWSYNSGGISKPSDVAPHWDEVSVHYQMPIDGDVWLEDPLHSSYPPSIAFKAAQKQDNHKAILFLRNLREMLFLQKKNITRWEYVAQAAQKASLDLGQLKDDYENKAKDWFQADLDLARKLGVRGFPTFMILDQAANHQVVYGVKPYSVFEKGILNAYPQAQKKSYAKDWESLFGYYPTLTAKEFAVLGEISVPEAQQLLDSLVEANKLTKLMTKNGALWTLKTLE